MNNDKLQEMLKSLPIDCRNFLNYLKAENKSHNTIVNYALDLRGWLTFQFKDEMKSIKSEDLNNIKLEDLYNYIGELSGKKASASIARTTGAIKSFFRYLNKFNIVAINPSLHLNSPKIQKRVPKYLTENEMIKLLESVDNGRSDSPERDYAMLLVFLTTGIRLSELINIKVKDVADNGMLTVTGKGDKQREIPLSNSCLNAIESYTKTRRNNSNILFTNKAGGQITPNGVQQLVKKYLKRIGKEDFSVHKLRHSAITNMLQNGANLKTLQEIAGHTSLKTTEIYAHVNSEQKRKAVSNTMIAKIKR